MNGDLISRAVADAMTEARIEIEHQQAAGWIAPDEIQHAADVSVEPEAEEEIMEAAEEEIPPATDELQGPAASCAAVSASLSGTGVTDPDELPIKLLEMESAVHRLAEPIADPAMQPPVLPEASPLLPVRPWPPLMELLTPHDVTATLASGCQTALEDW